MASLMRRTLKVMRTRAPSFRSLRSDGATGRLGELRMRQSDAAQGAEKLHRPWTRTTIGAGWRAHRGSR